MSKIYMKEMKSNSVNS